MYYEVYVDILFVENLWMDALLLFLTAKLFGRQIRMGRFLAASMTGSLGACLLAIGSASISRSGYFLGSLLLAMLMTGIAFGSGKDFWPAVIGLYLEGFLAGGMLRYVEQFYRMSGMVFLLTAGTAGTALYGLETLLLERRKETKRICHTVLTCGSCRMEVEGLLDTGNGLIDPASKSPVSLLNRACMELLLKGADTEPLPRMIPYRTISQQGILTAYRIDTMEIQNTSGTSRIRRPLIAVMPQSSERYPLILHRDLLSS